jgi:hypothetical protein
LAKSSFASLRSLYNLFNSACSSTVRSGTVEVQADQKYADGSKIAAGLLFSGCYYAVSRLYILKLDNNWWWMLLLLLLLLIDCWCVGLDLLRYIFTIFAFILRAVKISLTLTKSSFSFS